MNLLRCGPDPEQVRAAMARRESAELENAGEAVQVPLHIVRTKEEWDATEQGRIQAETPLIHIEKIADSDPIPLPQGERPLSGLKALEFVHAVAGPCVGRTLAMQGAEVLNLDMPDWVEFGNFFFTSQAGQRQAYLDARLAENRKKVYKLVEDADIFVENLRPGVANGRDILPRRWPSATPGSSTSVSSCAQTKVRGPGGRATTSAPAASAVFTRQKAHRISRSCRSRSTSSATS